MRAGCLDNPTAFGGANVVGRCMSIVLLVGLCYLMTSIVGAQTSGSITGSIVLDEDGQPLRGADLVAMPKSQAEGTRGLTAVSDPNGAFTITGLAPAEYVVCAFVRGSDLLQPCDWGGGEIAVVTAGGSANIHIRIKRGKALEIRVADPSQVLQNNEKRRTGVHFLAGVWDGGRFHPAKLHASNPMARVYTIVVPFERRVQLSVKGQKLRTRDVEGRAISSSAPPTDLLEPTSKNRTPRRFDFVIDGLEP